MTSHDATDPPSTPRAAAVAFFDAVRAGSARAIWETFSTEARSFIVERGLRRGLAPGLAESILRGETDHPQMEQFLEDVKAGIGKDLESVRMHLVELGEPEMDADERARIRYFERFEIPVGPPLDPLPVGSVHLVTEDGQWRVDRLVPRPGG